MQRPVTQLQPGPPGWLRLVTEAVERVVVGKHDSIEQCLIAVLAGGHVLIEDAPGVGKTTLARCLASALGLSFSRIQCTSDLLPSDVLGVTVFDQARSTFQFRPGPIFHQVVLVDELNRASPRTQSALLEAMGEGAVSVEGSSRVLPSPFLILATQNPLEHAGTYPLPDSQLDRFLMRVALGYPPPDAERRLLIDDGTRPIDPPPAPAGAGPESLQRAQQQTRIIHVAPEVADYLMRVVEASRQSGHLAAGASTRGALLLSRAARARALIRGRDHVLPDDVKALLIPCLSHRLTIAGLRQAPDRLEAERIIADLAERVPVP